MQDITPEGGHFDEEQSAAISECMQELLATHRLLHRKLTKEWVRAFDFFFVQLLTPPSKDKINERLSDTETHFDGKTKEFENKITVIIFAHLTWTSFDLGVDRRCRFLRKKWPRYRINMRKRSVQTHTPLEPKNMKRTFCFCRNVHRDLKVRLLRSLPKVCIRREFKLGTRLTFKQTSSLRAAAPSYKND